MTKSTHWYTGTVIVLIILREFGVWHS